MYVSGKNIYYYESEWQQDNQTVTTLRKISYRKGKLKAVAQGKVKGYLNDTFSLDEYKGNLRLFTTNDDENLVTILDKKLDKISSIENPSAKRTSVDIDRRRQPDGNVIFLHLSGLLSGGDDYITKPFSLRELEARIVTNIKREERHQQKTEYRFMDEMLIDYSEKIVAIAGHRMEFTKIEYQIIEFLSMHPGQVFDKERIYAQVCGYDAEGDSRTITELVRRIRKKIADYSEKEYIETVWGIGYRWKK